MSVFGAASAHGKLINLAANQVASISMHAEIFCSADVDNAQALLLVSLPCTAPLVGKALLQLLAGPVHAGQPWH